MAISEKFQRIHMAVSIGASVIAILSAVVAVAAYFKTGALQKLIDDTRRLDLRLSMVSPADGSEQNGAVVSWTGRLDLQVPVGARNNLNATLELAERQIQIVPFVRPLSADNRWWEQSAAAVDASGTLSGSLNLGAPDGTGVGLSYQVVLLVVRADAVSQGRTFTDLPPHSGASAVITVRRIK